MKSPLLALWRAASLLKSSSSRNLFRFKACWRLWSSWSFFRFAFLCCRILRRSLSKSRASLLNMHSHLARSFLSISSFRRSIFSKVLFLTRFRQDFGRCSCLSSMAICQRSFSSRFLVALLCRNRFGRYLFLSCMAICCRSHDCENLWRAAAVAWW